MHAQYVDIIYLYNLTCQNIHYVRMYALYLYVNVSTRSERNSHTNTHTHTYTKQTDTHTRTLLRHK